MYLTGIVTLNLTNSSISVSFLVHSLVRDSGSVGEPFPPHPRPRPPPLSLRKKAHLDGREEGRKEGTANPSPLTKYVLNRLVSASHREHRRRGCETSSCCRVVKQVNWPTSVLLGSSGRGLCSEDLVLHPDQNRSETI